MGSKFTDHSGPHVFIFVARSKLIYATASSLVHILIPVTPVKQRLAEDTAGWYTDVSVYVAGLPH